MPTKVWYEPAKKLYAIEFLDEPILDLPEWAAGREQQWSHLSYHLFAINIDNHILFHRLAIECQHLSGQTRRDDLGHGLTELASELRYMGRPPAEHNPTGFVSRPCLRAAEILEADHEALLERLLAENTLP